MCECGRGCSLQIKIGAADYARVRDVSTYFLVTPEHRAPEVDRVVEDHDSWLLVEDHLRRRLLAEAEQDSTP
jgi:hypothetical protein